MTQNVWERGISRQYFQSYLLRLLQQSAGNTDDKVDLHLFIKCTVTEFELLGLIQWFYVKTSQNVKG